jgi:hypothetical protein
MSTKDFTANVISATKVVPDGNFKDSKASGIWDINEALDLIKGGNWPNVANFNPAAFVDGLFQTTLWTGTGDGNTGAQDITTGIDLANKEGMLWLYNRDSATAPHIFDTIRGANVRLRTDRTTASGSVDDLMDSFKSDGFRVGVGTTFNNNTVKNVGFTFRSQPKFFDIVTYTGTGSAMTIDHNLGSVPGMIIVKSTSAAYDWAVWHREFTGSTDYIKLNTSAAKTDSAGVFGNGSNYLTPTSTQFFVGGNNQVSGEDGGGYVAYLFAHNNDDGGFGEPGDQDIIKCGSYTGNGSNDGPTINLGFEPQWLMIKDADGAENWQIFDNMRGMSVGQYPVHLYPNSAAAEGTIQNQFDINSTGFKITFNSNRTNANGDTYIYMAIRRGGMQTPTAASDVFALDDSSTTDNGGYTLNSNFPVDFYFFKNKAGGDSISIPRLTIGDLRFNSAGAEDDRSSVMNFDSNTGVTRTSFQGNIDSVDYAFRRALSFFDVVAYTGNGSNRTITHNLGVAPEMMWVKKRSGSNNWKTFHANLGGTKSMELNTTVEAETNGSALWNSTAPTASVFSLGSAGDVNSGSHTYIAMLFATVANVSKVGSFTQSGATNVACGFTGSTPAFIILKRTDAAGDWYLFDSERGIVAGNDPYLELNTSDAEVTNTDLVDPYSGGFATTSSLTNGDYIFYAIASIA